MRTGVNPSKAGLPAYTPQKLGIALIVYIPFMEGYFEHSLEIFKIQMDSIRVSTTQEFDLFVFDNGSCPEVVGELKAFYDRGWIDWLFLSRHNIGKAGAWNWIFANLPNELICYADSDVLFRAGWLEASLDVLEVFPQAGMVSAQPNFYDVMQGEGEAHQRLENDSRYQVEPYWPDKEIVEEYCLGIGASDELAARFFENPLPVLIHKPSGKRAVMGASHMQFIIPREVARQVVPLPATKALLRKETMSLDYKVDSLGYLHLSLEKPYVFHLGNTINDQLMLEVEKVLAGRQRIATPMQKNNPLSKSRVRTWLAKLARRPRFNQYLVRLYHFLFQVLNTKE